MTFPEFLRVVRRSWLLVILLVLGGITGGGAATYLATPQFTAETSLFVNVQTAGTTPGELVQGNSAAQQKVSSYVRVATSASVLQPVIDDLGLRTTPAALADRVTATANVNEVVIDIAVTDPDPATSAKIAASVGKQFAEYVTDDLETPTSGGPSLVKIGTLDAPVVPTVPTSPRLVQNVLVGFALGAVVGIALALLRNALDTKIRTPEDVQHLTEHPVVGGIAFDPAATRHPLVVQTDPRSPRAEAFRTLRTNVQFVDLDETARTFTVTSALPAEGKSTTAANLAIAMAENGARIAIVDADLRRPRLAEVLGVEGAIGLTDVLIGQAELEDVLQPWGTGGLHVLPAGRIPPNPAELLGSARMRALVEVLAEEHDYVVIDAPPLLPVTDAAILSRVTDGALLIAAAGRGTRKQVRTALDALASVGGRVFGIVMTMLPTKGSGSYGYGAYAAYYGRADDGIDHTAIVNGRGGRRAADGGDAARGWVPPRRRGRPA